MKGYGLVQCYFPWTAQLKLGTSLSTILKRHAYVDILKGFEIYMYINVDNFTFKVDGSIDTAKHNL